MTCDREANPDMTVAFVTGSEARLTEVAPALEQVGFSTHRSPSDALGLVAALRRAALPPRSVDCYVQMPVTDLDCGDPPTPAALRALVANALLARFDALAVVAPFLAPEARLVLVAGDRAGKIRDTDLGLPSVSAVLADAVLACSGTQGVVTTIVGDTSTAADIAAVARAQYPGRRGGGLAPPTPPSTGGGVRPTGPSPAVALAGYAAVSPHLSYVDWRDELLGLAAEVSDGHVPFGVSTWPAGPALPPETHWGSVLKK